jgi:(E)-4-hydroxy-3-methylbut-2-enyl-diphosphate synthase
MFEPTVPEGYYEIPFGLPAQRRTGKDITLVTIGSTLYRAIEAAESGAACLRINPGNIGSADRVRDVVKAAKDHGCSMRIGVNAGSLEKDLLEKYGEPCPEAMLESALNHMRILEDNDFREFKISIKASDVFLAVAAYQALADACDYPLHLGITEAGGLRTGTVKSAIGIGNLLWAGIGDTLRVSLSADPVEEVYAGFEILKALNLRHRGVNVIACPSCARQQFNVIKTVEILEKRLAHITTPMTEETVRTRYDALMAKVPMKRMGTPEEIAEGVVWMCSDKASFMTGASHVIDGGYYAA